MCVDINGDFVSYVKFQMNILINYITHYSDFIMGVIASQITSLTIVYSTVYSDVNQRKHLSSASLAFVRGIHRSPVNSTHKGPVTRKMFPFDDVIMANGNSSSCWQHIVIWLLIIIIIIIDEHLQKTATVAMESLMDEFKLTIRYYCFGNE